MTRHLLSITLLALTLTACQTSSTPENGESAPSAPDTVLTVGDGHNSQNSLDYTGDYAGLLPCADCEGIETKITLNQDHTYQKTSTYLGKDSPQTFKEKGTYHWDEAGMIVELENQDGPNQYLAGENTLTYLDGDGKRVEGALAPLYVLKKQ